MQNVEEYIVEKVERIKVPMREIEVSKFVRGKERACGTTYLSLISGSHFNSTGFRARSDFCVWFFI